MAANDPIADIARQWHGPIMSILKALIPAMFLFATIVPSQEASACSVPPAAFNPSEFSAGVIIEGKVQSSDFDGRMLTFTIDVERVVQGRYNGDDYTFSFFPALSGGACPPASTQNIAIGQRLVVYLEKRDAGLWRKGWMHYEEAMASDYRVRVPSGRDR